MINIKILNIKFIVMLLVCDMVLADNSVTVTAADLYSQKNWSEAIKAYKKVTKEQPDNAQAWYRMAQAHIHLNQGEKALQAIEHLSSARQIPTHVTLYLTAQAFSLTGRPQDMWASLNQAADEGMANLKDLEANPIWTSYRKDDRFSALKLKIDKHIRPCMHDDKYRAFDFWLGDWEVYGNLEKTGPLLGHNSITQTEQGCLMMEQWQGASGSTGTSMNYYDGNIRRWVQRWVSAGVSIDYSGGLIHLSENKQAMQLEGKIYYGSPKQQPQIRAFRGTWTPLDGGVVQQFFEESLDHGKTWNVWFNGFYFPVNKEAEQ